MCEATSKKLEPLDHLAPNPIKTCTCRVTITLRVYGGTLNHNLLLYDLTLSHTLTNFSIS